MLKFLRNLLNGIFAEKHRNTVVINATNIGSHPSGIAVYSLALLREFAKDRSGLRFIVYVNRNARNEISQIAFPANFTIRWISKFTAPDFRFPGHLLRLFYANLLALRHLRQPLFNTSQLEACFFHPNQIITIHDIIPVLFKEFHGKQYYYFMYLLPLALRTARQIFTPSQHTKMLLNTIFGISSEKIQVVHNGFQRIDDVEATPETAPKTPYLLYIGRLCPMKNIGALIDAFRQLADRIPHKLVIIGEDERYLDRTLKYDDFVNTAVKNGRIVFKKYLPKAEMFSLLRNAEVFVFPSLYEGFGMPVLEAMHCGCPVVTSFAASIPEVCGDAAFYTDPHNPGSIADGILSVLSDPQLRENLIEKGFLKASQYRWERSAAHYLSTFQDAVAATAVGESSPVSIR